MRILSSFIILALAVSGCGILSKNSDQDPNLKTINLHGTVHKPYCGGAAPSPDVAAGYYESMKYGEFNLVQGSEFKEGMKVYKIVSLDVGGNATFQIEKGDYMMIRSDKFLSLEDFQKKNSEIVEENYEIKGTECFVNWKNTVDLYFTVVNDTVIEYREKAKCWVGTNQCLKYVGPPAP